MFLYKVRSTCCGGLAEVMEAVVVGRSVSGKICVVVDSPTKWDLSLSLALPITPQQREYPIQRKVSPAVHTRIETRASV